MRLSDDDPNSVLSDETIAARAARLAAVCEKTFQQYNLSSPNALPPVYVIGSEVPIPGGSQDEEGPIAVTQPKQLLNTYRAFRQEFARKGLEGAFARVIAIVVQPGVEFSDTAVHPYCRDAAKELVETLKALPDLVFEGHSTDYQTPKHLMEMVQDGIAILKVGPALTFALREALFLLEDMEGYLLPYGDANMSGFKNALEQAMLAQPNNWKKHYHGTADELAFKRKFSFSDRCRYYLPVPEVEKAVAQLLDNIDNAALPISLLSQYMPNQYKRVCDGALPLKAKSLVKNRIRDMIDCYLCAVT
jgi:D-tagatose-1,6-bisphosphate aldolase subunit GatZ/KbaZ